MNMRYKTMDAKDVKINDILEGYNIGHTHTYLTGKVLSVSSDKICISYGSSTKYIDVVDGIKFKIRLTENEIKCKYKDAAERIFKALQNKLYIDECGCHEMDNSVISYDVYEFAENCEDRNVSVVGYFELSSPKISMFGTILDCGICFEDNATFERFWCHYSNYAREYLVHKFSREHNNIV